MTTQLILIASLVTSLIKSHGPPDGADPTSDSQDRTALSASHGVPGETHSQSAAPLVPTAKKMVRTDGKTGYAIRLNLLPGIEIYTETAPTAFPLRLEFLDAHGGAVAAQMVYPRSKAVQMDGLWEPYSVYRHPSPVTVYGYPAGPVTHVTIFYHGFHHHRGH